VVHTAGVLDDATIETLSRPGLESVLAAKAESAWYLHELTAGLDLSAFVLFSSVAGVFGGAGQGNYAAANAFLDSLAVHRRSQGLPGVSLAWGMWLHSSGMTSQLTQADRDRAQRAGLRPLSTDEALRLLDIGVANGEPMLVPINIDTNAIRARAQSAADIPALLRGIIRTPLRQAAANGAAGTLRERVAAANGDREAIALEAVRQEVAAVLGYRGPADVAAGQAFNEMGFDSLTAVELRNRINRTTGLSLSATLVFDYPTPAALAGHLLTQMEPPRMAGIEALDHLEEFLAALPVGDSRTAHVHTRLRHILTRWNETQQPPEDDLETASDDELIAILGKELGGP
jgi:acyl carrier protein